MMNKRQPKHRSWDESDQFTRYPRPSGNGSGWSDVKDYEPTVGVTITVVATAFLLIVLFLALSVFSTQESVRRGGQSADYALPMP